MQSSGGMSRKLAHNCFPYVLFVFSVCCMIVCRKHCLLLFHSMSPGPLGNGKAISQWSSGVSYFNSYFNTAEKKKKMKIGSHKEKAWCLRKKLTFCCSFYGSFLRAIFSFQIISLFMSQGQIYTWIRRENLPVFIYYYNLLTSFSH